jgi:hypothetical protein
MKMFGWISFWVWLFFRVLVESPVFVLTPILIVGGIGYLLGSL